jgi:hypothetical protein
VAILDVASRRVLSFRVSNTMRPDFCVEALEEAIERFGAPEIMNTDQGSQFTSEASTGAKVQAGLTRSFDFYNRERLHQSREYQTPDEIYFATAAVEPLTMAALRIAMNPTSRIDRKTGDPKVAGHCRSLLLRWLLLMRSDFLGRSKNQELLTS